ncbi:hypothetical protein [Undibacterium sp. YM2]|uniref:hypothetical protein n=1 Tax=Undibacterium sp. YM2 TaxID=2058625 RepID=UPI001389553F|nr:hypothetical protein [Undibacterium sp. YM2]
MQASPKIMTEIHILKDQQQGAFFRGLRKSMPLWLVVGVILMNIYFYKSWVLPACLIVALCIAMPWQFSGRNRWGDQLIFTPSELTVMKGGEIVDTIDFQSLKQKNFNDDTFTCVWEKNGKRKFIIVGRESFSDESWQKLADAYENLNHQVV